MAAVCLYWPYSLYYTDYRFSALYASGLPHDAASICLVINTWHVIWHDKLQNVSCYNGPHQPSMEIFDMNSITGSSMAHYGCQSCFCFF